MANRDEEYTAAPPQPAPPYPGQPAQYPAQPAYVQPGAAPAGYVQPAPQVVYVPQPVPADGQPTPAETAAAEARDGVRETIHGPEMTIISHSMLFYWWPVWVVGYLMALFTWTNGQTIVTENMSMVVHPSNNPGILFFLTVFLVVVITNLEVRGLASAMVLMGIALVALTLAYFRWWDDVLRFVGHLNIYINQGAYFWFSTLMLLIWAFAFFVFDRMSYWIVKPGQVTRVFVWGASSDSYDTENMTLEKRRDDFFRHWLLGLGTGDLKIHTYGARAKEIHIPNVLFVGSRIAAIEKMIAMEPGEVRRPTGV
jgi:hypothetical protein